MLSPPVTRVVTFQFAMFQLMTIWCATMQVTVILGSRLRQAPRWTTRVRAAHSTVARCHGMTAPLCIHHLAPDLVILGPQEVITQTPQTPQLRMARQSSCLNLPA
jgi:hypothetical protein